MSRAWLILCFAAFASPAFATDGGTPEGEWATLPGGAPSPDSAAPLTDEDREVIEHLELLESMETAEALELLLELSNEEDER